MASATMWSCRWSVRHETVFPRLHQENSGVAVHADKAHTLGLTRGRAAFGDALDTLRRHVDGRRRVRRNRHFLGEGLAVGSPTGFDRSANRLVRSLRPGQPAAWHWMQHEVLVTGMVV